MWGRGGFGALVTYICKTYLCTPIKLFRRLRVESDSWPERSAWPGILFGRGVILFVCPWLELYYTDLAQPIISTNDEYTWRIIPKLHESSLRLRCRAGSELLSSRYLELGSTSRRKIFWMCIIFLGSPDPAGVGLGRSRFMSLCLAPQKMCFS